MVRPTPGRFTPLEKKHQHNKSTACSVSSLHYALGSLEIAEVLHPTEDTITVKVRVARPNSYAWCGVVQAASDGRVLHINLTPRLLKTYGVRSTQASTVSNELLTVPIARKLQQKADYDLYCYSEVIGEMLSGDAAKLHDEEKVKREILASRLRVTMDSIPPNIMITSLYSTHHTVNITFTIDESADVWCLAEKAPARTNPLDFTDPLPLFSPDGALAETLEALDSNAAALRVARYFKTLGTSLSLKDDELPSSAEAARNKEITAYILLSGLIPGTEYDVLCYAEDYASPKPNVMSPLAVQDTVRPTRTESKTPTVSIRHHLTLLKGFRLFASLDAPGHVWCAAAPASYGTPDLTEVIRVGAYTNTTEPFKEVVLDIRGVEPNTAYRIFCVAGTSTVVDPFQELDQLTSQDAMTSSALSVISYGRYCDVADRSLETGAPSAVVSEDAEITPFHPIRTDEEIRIREFMLSRPELNLQGIYRINLLPNKTEIYDYYDNQGPKPERYARVRAGRCENDVGYYEQFRVGPLTILDPNDPTAAHAPLTYQRLARPVETECGGYNPQGVFGRRRRRALSEFSTAGLFFDLDYDATKYPLKIDSQIDNDTSGFVHQDFFDFMKASFGYTFPGLNTSCPLSHSGRSNAGSKTHESKLKNDASLSNTACFEYGPVLLEETCPQTGNVNCTAENRGSRVWLGMKTPRGERIPFYFMYNLTSPPAEIQNLSKEVLNETVYAWAQRVVQNRELPHDFHALWDTTSVWYDGRVYDGIPQLLQAIADKSARVFTPKTFRDHRDDIEKTLREKTQRERRQLDPMPYPGAAGTAGPLPSRDRRRTGLEYLAHPEHIEAQGTRFRVKASTDLEEFTITYAGWSMTVNNDRDTGLRIYNLRFLDKRVAFEMGVMEALAHYTVSERNWFFLDSWYGGLGSAARKVHKGKTFIL